MKTSRFQENWPGVKSKRKKRERKIYICIGAFQDQCKQTMINKYSNNRN